MSQLGNSGPHWSYLGQFNHPTTSDEWRKCFVMGLIPLTVGLEAGNQSFTGKILVAEVIRNRWTNQLDDKNLKDLAQIVLAPYQFSPFNTGEQGVMMAKYREFYNSPNLLKECCLAVNLAFNEGTNFAKGALFFHNPTISSPKYYSPKNLLVSEGDHVFYKDLITPEADRWPF